MYASNSVHVVRKRNFEWVLALHTFHSRTNRFCLCAKTTHQRVIQAEIAFHIRVSFLVSQHKLYDGHLGASDRYHRMYQRVATQMTRQIHENEFAFFYADFVALQQKQHLRHYSRSHSHTAYARTSPTVAKIT